MDRYERERLEMVEFDRCRLFFLDGLTTFGVWSFDIFLGDLRFSVVADITVEDFFDFKLELDSEFLKDSISSCFNSLSND